MIRTILLCIAAVVLIFLIISIIFILLYEWATHHERDKREKNYYLHLLMLPYASCYLLLLTIVIQLHRLALLILQPSKHKP